MSLSYSELSASAKEKARNNFIEHWIHEDWQEHVYEDMIERGKELGFLIDRIAYSGFWSQGDGASWEGVVVVSDFLATRGGNSIGYDCWRWLREQGVISDHINITNPHNHYCHSGVMRRGDMFDFDNTTDYGDDDDVITIDCVIKGMPIRAVFDLIASDTECDIKCADDLGDWALEEAKQYADEIYKNLESAYDWECSEANIEDVYNANDIKFDEEGVILL